MMSEKERKTVFIAGHEMDRDIADNLFRVVRNSVPRVVEELVIAGKTDEYVKAAAKTTAEAVVWAFVAACQNAMVSAQASPTLSSRHPQHTERQTPEAR